MLAHPEHHLDWRLRRAFYLELGNETAWARAFRGWLAVLSAQHTLPILLRVCPHDNSIFDELSACIAHLSGKESPHDLHRLTDLSYHGHWWPVIHFNGKPIENAIAVLFASYKAMLEVKRWDGELGWLDPFEFSTVLDEHGREKTDITDEEWIHTAGVGDAASAAAVASACSEDSTACDPERLKTFWLWWLDEAWRLAARLAMPDPQEKTTTQADPQKEEGVEDLPS